MVGRMMLVNNEDGSAGPILIELIVCVVFGPVALLLKPQTVNIHALNFPHGFKPSFATWAS